MAVRPGRLEPDLHTVVFDINVLLDVAELVGPPFTWSKFTDLAVRHGASPVPHATDRRIDSLKAIGLTKSGRFAGTQLLEVWTSQHIDDLLIRKAMHPRDGATPEASGLGWSTDDAEGLLHDFLYDLVFDNTSGARVELDGVDGHPPLDHEDACVFSTALQAASDMAPPSIKYCVTRDRTFRRAPNLDSRVLMLHPDEFVLLVQKSRRALAIGRIPPPRK